MVWLPDHIWAAQKKGKGKGNGGNGGGIMNVLQAPIQGAKMWAPHPTTPQIRFRHTRYLAGLDTPEHDMKSVRSFFCNVTSIKINTPCICICIRTSPEARGYRSSALLRNYIQGVAKKTKRESVVGLLEGSIRQNGA